MFVIYIFTVCLTRSRTSFIHAERLQISDVHGKQNKLFNFLYPNLYNPLKIFVRPLKPFVFILPLLIV